MRGAFRFEPPCGILLRVILWLALRRLIPLLAVIGFALAPMAASAAAGGMGAPKPAMTDHRYPETMPDMDMSDMGDMPCCPGRTPALPDCGTGCPLMALCLAQLASVIPVAAGVPSRIAVPIVGRRHGTTSFASLASPPPPEPPRS